MIVARVSSRLTRYINGPINGERFRAYVQTQLLPNLKYGDVVVVDNLASHKSAEVRKMIRAVGARIFFLPAYSPDLNPIEQLFSNIKQHMRAAMARSVDAVHDAVANALDAVTPNECANYFVNSGYAPTYMQTARARAQCAESVPRLHRHPEAGRHAGGQTRLQAPRRRRTGHRSCKE